MEPATWILILCLKANGGGCSYRSTPTVAHVTEAQCRTAMPLMDQAGVLAWCLGPDEKPMAKK